MKGRILQPPLNLESASPAGGAGVPAVLAVVPRLARLDWLEDILTRSWSFARHTARHWEIFVYTLQGAGG